MMERLRRLILWLMMLALTLMIYMKSHGTEREVGAMAFFNDYFDGITVKITGNVDYPGTYQLPEKSNVASAINMTVSPSEQMCLDIKYLQQPLSNGDVVEVLRESRQRTEIKVKKMQTREKIILGIALDPNLMGRDDWDILPGIGPVLAERIIHDRQLNGDFASFSDLSRVPGLGEVTIKKLTSYF